ncbi:fructose bisphosphate aldolase [Mycobacterium sp. 1245111.1]|uniref:fructose bisphosphate aldolase n=1 Tax=Mycobacterium sp. 1245111.1 TaxID=1834073 RepID=UPI0007FED011|nr:fructose bisphosphate aldolase [Mycobacterium sp. 1245111.1]OBK40882.1 fructose bisphosphate aldolase [Mycobacterium sp. 1245111.1]
MNDEQLEEMRSGRGFIAALDQSGGSTPKALALYGIPEHSYGNEGQMFDLMHQARARLIESPSFTGDKILAAILFEQTMDRTVAGEDTVSFLWKQKHIVPFVKVDQGLADVQYGVQLMKPLTKLETLLERAVAKGVFGTKMRSFIQEANGGGIAAIVDQQFEAAETISRHDLMPIIEPEVSIKTADKPTADRLLVEALQAKLDELPDDRQVMLKLTLPDEADLYTPLIEHPRVLRVVALSGGYSLAQSADMLSRNHRLIASFSRALTEGLTVDQSDAEFDEKLKANIDEIYDASVT